MLREERNYSQDKLAEELGIKRSTLGMWENNRRIPSEDAKELIADYFNVDMNYLYGKSDIRNSYRNNKDSDISITPNHFTSPEEAMQFIVKQPMIALYGGYDLDKMTDDEVIDFANTVLDLLKIAAKQIK